MDDWQENACVFSNPKNQTTLTKIVCDPFRDLIWTADSTGRVASFYGPLLRPYTCFPATFGGPVFTIQISERFVYTLSKDGVACHKRSGVLVSRHSEALGLQMLILDDELLIATSSRLVLYSLSTMKESGSFAVEAPESVSVLFLKRSFPHVLVALSDGRIQVLDSHSFDPVDTRKCHSGSITDIDSRKNVVMTCGMSARQYGVVNDQIVYVYDSRNLKPLPLITVSAGVVLVRINPRSPSNCVVAGPSGQLYILDTKHPENLLMKQALLHSPVLGLDISPKGDRFVIAEQNGLLHLWTRGPIADVAAPKELELPATQSLELHRELETLSCVGMPYYKTELLSSWSSPDVFDVGKVPGTLSSIRGNVAVAYVPLSRLNRRSSMAVPRFISEKKGSNERLDLENDDSIKHGKTPKAYRQLQIYYSKFGVDDFDFGFYNKTLFSGLENHESGISHYNSLLQLLRWCPPLYNILLHIFAKFNYKSLEFVGELAMLFDMLHKGKGTRCKAANFYSLLFKTSEARSLSLNDSQKPVNEQIRSLFEFLITQLGNEDPSLQGLSCLNSTRIYGSCGHRANTTTSTTHLRCRTADISGLCAALSRSTDSWMWCEQCQKQHSMATVSQLTSKPPALFVSLDARSEPSISFNLVSRADKRSFKAVEVQDDPEYTLQGYVAEISDGNAHAVAIINVQGTWHLFNDFLVTPISQEDALDFRQTWKRAILLMYSHRDAEREFDYESWKEKIDTRLLHDPAITAGNLNAETRAQMLTSDEITPGFQLALDAEFVSVAHEVSEIHSDGTKSLLKPSTQSLARVSVVRAQGPLTEVPCIDDFVMNTEPIKDYLTLYSGIEPGDLDPETSRYGLVDLKTAVRRLWILVNRGCIFIGHALENDFRTINLRVPPEQIIDTFELYHDKKITGPRRFSLKFLVWACLGDRIQTGNHDSIEDASSALRLYNKYKELCKTNELESVLQKISSMGQAFRFKVPTDMPVITL